MEILSAAGIFSDQVCKNSNGHVGEVVAFDELWKGLKVQSYLVLVNVWAPLEFVGIFWTHNAKFSIPRSPTLLGVS